MTDNELDDIFKIYNKESLAAAQRALFECGYYHGAGTSPTASSLDTPAKTISKATAVTKLPPIRK